MELSSLLAPNDAFLSRHIGSNEATIAEMLEVVGYDSLDALIAATIPDSIRLRKPLALPPIQGESATLEALRVIARKNVLHRSFIGMGYHGCLTPAVIQRNILENPGWYTQYTPYQAEISQGRLEALLSFQTMVSDLTALPLSNASMLDEGTAAAEAMTMCQRVLRTKRRDFFVADDCHPQTIAVVKTRAGSLGINVHVGAIEALDLEQREYFGVLLQYPNTLGALRDDRALIADIHASGALAIMATDLLALTLLTPPGELGADVAVGSAQRFGVPMGFGGPHAAFLSASEKYARQMPGRIVGVSLDADGKPAYRLALQTREQHIRRARATSNICTSQVLLAIMASMYAVYHGPQGLKRIAERTRGMTLLLAEGLKQLGFQVADAPFFDTLCVSCDADVMIARALSRGINLRRLDEGRVGIALDETVEVSDVEQLFLTFSNGEAPGFTLEAIAAAIDPALPSAFARTSDYLTHEIFHLHHSEHELLRYIHRLQSGDLSLTTSMIPLGSCTMKLNATSEILPISWPEFSLPHPYAPKEQVLGYAEMLETLEGWLAEITGFAAASLQPNAGSQGEYAGLLSIRGYHRSRGDAHRDVCLIPSSAHGTNPASAVIAGFKVITIQCDELGNIDLSDLEAKAEKHRDALGALMITYPSTHGVFEEGVQRACEIIHERGGQVYLDGANMNAQVGLCRPGDYGADVCHLNLHKTFCIPHGGGGPGMGPICAAEHLRPFLPGHPLRDGQVVGPVSAAPYGSASILPIPYVYIALAGAEGLKRTAEVAILNANYMAKRLSPHYSVLYTGSHGTVAHEFIIDCRPFKQSAGVTVEDIAKRLMDYGFHAPTMSWPVAGTLMIEPTESESRDELDRFCEALICIRAEIQAIEAGEMPREGNVLSNAPHTASMVTAEAWEHPYSRAQAAYPIERLRHHKFWPPTRRIDNAYGDRHLVCSCPPMAAYESD